MNDIPNEVLIEWFDLFWTIYWRKIAKKDAFKAWLKHVHSEELFTQIMDAVRLQHCHMMKRQPEFRPHAATWLNGARWNDVLNESGEYRPYQASKEQQAISDECKEYVTLHVVPTVPEGPHADEWRKKHAR